MLSSTQPHGALAAVSAPAGLVPAGSLADHDSIPAVRQLRAGPSEARALDVLGSVTARDRPQPTPVVLGPATPAPTPAPTRSPKPAADRSAAPAPTRTAQPAGPRVRLARAATRPDRLWAQLRRGLTVTGQATWYAGTRGYTGIAHVAMPGARYLARGRSAPRAQVCAGGRCTVVAVVDACACRAGTPRARVADLSVTTLRRLGLDPRRGVYQVRVTLLAP
jgi:hypothetical protein